MDIQTLSTDDKRRIYSTIKLYEETKSSLGGPPPAADKDGTRDHIMEGLRQSQAEASRGRLIGMAFLLGMDDAVLNNLPKVITFLKEAIRPDWEK